MSSNLDAIHEVYDSVNYNLDLNEEDPEKIISELQEKIMRLEKMNNDLKSKNEDLKKNNIENDSVMKKMGHVGMRRKLTSQGTFKQVQNDSLKIAELIKEKDDLQEINEKMLDLLTEKELENEDLNQKFEDYKLEVKLENEKNLEKIQSLEDKIDLLENAKGGTMYDIDEVVNEYNKSKDSLKQQINDYSKIEQDLKAKLEMKDRTIEKLNEDIQKLEIEKLKLINQNTKKDKILKEKEVFEIEKLKTQIDKLKREVTFSNDQLKVEKDNTEKLSESHKKEIENFQKKLEEERNNTNSIREEKIKEINILKAEITKVNKELHAYTKKAELTEKRLDDEKQKNFMVQNKLDKKSKELSEMNEYTKKLLVNKDNENSEIIENNNAESKKDDNNDIQQYIHENKLLTEEIKGLKDQLGNQAKDLIDLNSFEKELVRLKAQNETLAKDNKILKIRLDEYKRNEEGAEFNLEGGGEEKSRLTRRDRKRGLTIMNDKTRKMTLSGKRPISHEAQINQLNFQKQLNALKKVKEEEKNDFDERINKMYKEVADLKVKNLNLTFTIDALKIKYKNMIKSVTNQCNKKGIKLNFNQY